MSLNVSLTSACRLVSVAASVARCCGEGPRWLVRFGRRQGSAVVDLSFGTSFGTSFGLLPDLWVVSRLGHLMKRPAWEGSHCSSMGRSSLGLQGSVATTRSTPVAPVPSSSRWGLACLYSFLGVVPSAAFVTPSA